MINEKIYRNIIKKNIVKKIEAIDTFNHRVCIQIQTSGIHCDATLKL